MIQQYRPIFSRSVLSVLALTVMMTPFWGFISTWGGTVLGPLWLWKALPDIAVAFLAVVVIVWSLIDHKPARQIILNPAVGLALIYTLVSLIVTFLMFSGQNEQLVAGLAFGLRYVAVFLIAYVAYIYYPVPMWRSWLMKWCGGLALLLVMIGIVQVTIMPADFLAQFGYQKDETIAPVLLIDENPDAKRAYATTRGPNDYAAWLLIPLGLALSGVWKNRIRYGVQATALLGIIISGSRSAWLAAGTMIVLHIWYRYRLLIWHNIRYRLTAIGIMLSIIVIGLATMSVPALRLAIFHSSPDDTHLTEGSTEQHWIATSAGIQRVLENPLGCGLGCAGPASTYGLEARISENHYVQIAEEVGIFGVVIWCALFAVVMWGLFEIRKSSLAYGLFLAGIGLALVGLLLHVWADVAVSMTFWLLAGLVLASGSSRKVKNEVL